MRHSCGTFTARMNWNNFDSIIWGRGKATLAICSSMHLFQSIHQHAWHLLPKIQIIISVVTAKVDQNVGCQASLLNFGGIFFSPGNTDWRICSINFVKRTLWKNFLANSSWSVLDLMLGCCPALHWKSCSRCFTVETIENLCNWPWHV